MRLQPYASPKFGNLIPIKKDRLIGQVNETREDVGSRFYYSKLPVQSILANTPEGKEAAEIIQTVDSSFKPEEGILSLVYREPASNTQGMVYWVTGLDIQKAKEGLLKACQETLQKDFEGEWPSVQRYGVSHIPMEISMLEAQNKVITDLLKTSTILPPVMPTYETYYGGGAKLIKVEPLIHNTP